MTATVGCRAALFDCIPKRPSTLKETSETGNNADGGTDGTPDEEALDEDPGGLPKARDVDILLIAR